MGARMEQAARLAAVAVVGALALAACGGGGQPAARAAVKASPPVAATAPADPAAASRQVISAYETFFSSATPRAQQVSLLEDGPHLGAAMDAAARLLSGGTVTVTVSRVTFTSPTKAGVTYTLSTNGTAVLPDANGSAVLDGGAWKVSKATFCGLVALGASDGKAPGCS